MSLYKVHFKRSAAKSLKKIRAEDREKIAAAIVGLRTTPRPPGSIKITNQNAYRIRQGDYRIIYTIDNNILTIEIIKIGHRRDIYK
ncbi:MAG: type II toxin-antitoxin system RelE family toxin [Akkermansiaceae bacterium]